MGSGPYSGWVERSVRAGLLAWLILALGAPAPAVLRDGLGSPVGSEREDSAPEDTPPTENETALDPELDQALLPGTIPGPVAGSNGSPPRSSPLDKREPDSGPPVVDGSSTGHFLDDGRELRLWLRSLTC